MNRRDFIGGGAVCAAGSVLALEEKISDGGLMPVSWADRKERERAVLPPGAHSAKRFASKCVGCGLCAASCPSKCLRPSTVPGRMGRVELDFRYGWCKPGCTKCGEMCPAGAIEKVAYVSRRLYHVGYAVWERAKCVRTTDGVECHACEKHCPVRAVKIVKGFPVVDRIACIGCGACEHYCPARPETAIRVVGYECHREIGPMEEGDLADEMQRLVKSDCSAVVAKNGVIVRILNGRGLKPIEDAYAADREVFAGAVVADKVVGVGAAKVYVAGRAAKVWGRVMSESAKRLLEDNGIESACDELVEALDCERRMHTF